MARDETVMLSPTAVHWRDAGEPEMRKLAEKRDEAGAAWWFFLWAHLPTAISPPDCAQMSNAISGDQETHTLRQPSPLQVVPTVASGDTVPPGDATILPYRPLGKHES